MRRNGCLSVLQALKFGYEQTLRQHPVDAGQPDSADVSASVDVKAACVTGCDFMCVVCHGVVRGVPCSVACMRRCASSNDGAVRGYWRAMFWLTRATKLRDAGVPLCWMVHFVSYVCLRAYVRALVVVGSAALANWYLAGWLARSMARWPAAAASSGAMVRRDCWSCVLQGVQFRQQPALRQHPVDAEQPGSSGVSGHGGRVQVCVTVCVFQRACQWFGARGARCYVVCGALVAVCVHW